MCKTNSIPTNGVTSAEIRQMKFLDMRGEQKLRTKATFLGRGEAYGHHLLLGEGNSWQHQNLIRKKEKNKKSRRRRRYKGP
jgi:hypothetical protein